VDLHALTLEIEPATLRDQTLDLIATYLAAGLDPDICSIFLRATCLPRPNELVARVRRDLRQLSRMTQFKEKSHASTATASALTYPS